MTRVSRPWRRFLQAPQSATALVRALLDLLAIESLLVMHAWLKGGDFDAPYRMLAVVTLLVTTVVYNTVGIYYRRLDAASDVWRLTRAWMGVIGILILIAFVTKTSAVYSREVILTWAISAWAAQVLVYGWYRRATARRRSEARSHLPTLIVGSGELARLLREHLEHDSPFDEHIVGHADDVPPGAVPGHDLLGGLADVPAMIDRLGIRRVYLALPIERSGTVRDLAQRLGDRQVDVVWAPDVLGLDLLNFNVREIGGMPVISLSETPLLGAPALVKDAFDKVAATLLLILFSPLMLAVAAAVKLTSPGPVFFRQQRHGWDGRVFEVLKFRSMYTAPPGADVQQARRGDPRVTAVGRLIRRTSIDELPQLFNVLGGTMSLVGPRPHAIAHNEFYSERIASYMRRHRIKPGLTGLAQVNGLRGETETIEKMEARVQHDIAYINNWSIWLDVRILFQTLFVVLFQRNAY
jgi:putative colanic acid biosynthesis UDP-glucose lipid carrier transferase